MTPTPRPPPRPSPPLTPPPGTGFKTTAARALYRTRRAPLRSRSPSSLVPRTLSALSRTRSHRHTARVNKPATRRRSTERRAALISELFGPPPPRAGAGNTRNAPNLESARLKEDILHYASGKRFDKRILEQLRSLETYNGHFPPILHKFYKGIIDDGEITNNDNSAAINYFIRGVKEVMRK